MRKTTGIDGGPSWRRADSACVAALLAGVLLATWPMIEVWRGEAPAEQGPGGSIYVHYHLLYTARTTILTHGQLPLRSPWHGGYPTIGFPYDSTLSPRLLLALAFGEVPAVKLDFVLMYGTLAVGMYLLGRWVAGLGAPGSTAAAALAAFSGLLPGMMLVGTAARARWCLLPLLLALVASRRRPRASLVAGALVYALMIADGGLTMIGAGVLLVLVALLQLHPTTDVVRPFDPRFVIRAAGVVAWGALIGLPKLVMGQYAVGAYSTADTVPLSGWSVLFWLLVGVWLWGVGARRWAARRWGRRAGAAWTAAVIAAPVCLALFATLLAPTAAQDMTNVVPRRLSNQWALMTEFRRVTDFSIEADVWRTQTWFTIAVGYGWLAVAVLGAVVCWRRFGRWTVLLAVAFVDQIGHSLPFDLVVLSQHLPLLRTLDSQVERLFLQPVVLFCVAVLCGAAIDWLWRRGRRHALWAAIAAAAVVANTAWLIPQHWRGIREAYQYRAPTGQPAPRFCTLFLENDRADLPWCYVWARRNVAALPWDMRVKDPRWRAIIPRAFARDDHVTHLNPAYPGDETWLTPPTAGTIEWADDWFTPTRIRLTVALTQPGVLVINQPFDPAWGTTAGEIIPHRGRLAVVLREAGRHDVRLSYRPLRFYVAAAVGLMALAALPVFLLVRRLVRRSHGM